MQSFPSTLFVASALVLYASVTTPVHAAEAPQSEPTVHVIGSKQTVATPAESAYAVGLRDHLNGAARYPTGRDVSLEQPSGTTQVWVDVSRNGDVIGRGISRSSESGALDRMAVSLVGRTHYASLPADAWAGQSDHRFVVNYRFVAKGDRQDAGSSAEVVAE